MTAFFLIATGVILIDQLTKQVAASYLREHGSITIIADWFKFTYTENTGIAFGVDPGSRIILIGGTALILAAILGYVLWSSNRSPLFLSAFSLIFGGGIGNLIDRIAYGSVIDFLHLDLYNGYILDRWVSLWPVFNLADSAITIGAVLLVVFYKQIFPQQ